MFQLADVSLLEDVCGSILMIKLKIQSDYNRNIINKQALFTLKGGDMITNKYLGVGRENGLSSGDVASPVAGTKLIMWGYSSLAVFNPYRSYVIREI